jgi:hypothetical protein
MKLSRTIAPRVERSFEALDDGVGIEIIETGHGHDNRRRLQDRDLRERAVELTLRVELELPCNDDGVACFVGKGNRVRTLTDLFRHRYAGFPHCSEKADELVGGETFGKCDACHGGTAPCCFCGQAGGEVRDGTLEASRLRAS